jgi:transcriptional regulator with XRE-family HTH domain
MCRVRRLRVDVISVPRKQTHQKIIGESIRKHRKASGMSQEKLAEKADLHPVYFGQVERGEQTASVHALMRIAKALGVRVRDLVEDL